MRVDHGITTISGSVDFAGKKTQVRTSVLLDMMVVFVAAYDKQPAMLTGLTETPKNSYHSVGKTKPNTVRQNPFYQGYVKN